MRSVVVMAVFSVLVVFALTQNVEACVQIDPPSVSIRSRSVAGTVTLNGKPIAGAVLSLHKFLGPYAVELAHADSLPLGTATAAKDGSFNFGEVPTGKYVMFMAWPSSEVTAIEVVRPKTGENDTVSVSFFGSFCQSAAAISATGKRLSHSTPPVWGASGNNN
jgi:hypothetical protein